MMRMKLDATTARSRRLLLAYIVGYSKTQQPGSFLHPKSIETPRRPSRTPVAVLVTLEWAYQYIKAGVPILAPAPYLSGMIESRSASTIKQSRKLYLAIQKQTTATPQITPTANMSTEVASPRTRQQPALASRGSREQARQNSDEQKRQRGMAPYFPLGYKEAVYQWVCLIRPQCGVYEEAELTLNSGLVSRRP